MGNLRVFQCSFKDISKKSRKFPECFDRLSRKFLKHINSLSKKVCFVVVVCHSSQLPEQKEGLFIFTHIFLLECIPAQCNFVKDEE